MSYFVAGLLLVLGLSLLVWAIVDILVNKKDKSLILLILLAPYVGPLIYFQTKARG